MTKKLKTLSGIAFEGGPIYLKFQLYLKDWMKAYGKRNAKGDVCVVKFIKHFAELEDVTTTK